MNEKTIEQAQINQDVPIDTTAIAKEKTQIIDTFFSTIKRAGELLSEEDKEEYIRLSDAIEEYEAAYHPLPGRVSTLLTDTIREKMQEKGYNQRQTAQLLGISESRVSDLLNGRRPLNLNIAKRLRDYLNIPADFILDCACL